MTRKTAIIFLLMISMSSGLFAGGFQVRLQGQKQTGIGLIGTPFAFDASSNFYNPGSLGFIEGKWSFSAGASGIFSKQAYQMTGTDYQEWSDNPIGTPFYVYGSAKLTDYLSLGVGVNTPFGSSVAWDDQWAGRYLIQNIKLSAIFIQPTLAYNYKKVFGIGAGFVYAIGNVRMEKGLPYNDNSGVVLEGKSSNIGFNIGAYVRPTEKITIGIDYRSSMTMEVEDGDATFTVPSALSANIPAENKFSADLPLPSNLELGISFQINEKLLIAIEEAWVRWSVYEEMAFTFEENGELLNSTNPREFKDSWVTRVGLQYQLNDMVTFRCGGYYDPSPANDKYFTPETVSLNTIAFTLGASIEPLEGLSIDLSYLQVHGLEADKTYEPANFSGTYKSIGFLPGIGLSYTF
jgi:long-chain fatty acid transport protein